MQDLSTNQVTLICFLAIVAVAAAVLLGIKDLLTRDKSPAAALRRFPQLSSEQRGGIVARFDRWFERTVYLSGIRLGVPAATLLILLVGLLLGGTAYAGTGNLFFTALCGVLGAVAVIAGLAIARRHRVKRFQLQFPGALDLLARAVRAGESLDQAITLVGESSPEPVATEFRRCAGQLELGLSVAATLRGMSARMDLMDVRILSNTLSVHRDLGGNLATTLERLAAVIQDRMNYHRQLKSVTGAGRFSVLLLTAMGPLLFAYMFLFQPEYGGRLLEDPLGRGMLAFAVIAEIVGILWASRLLKADY